MTNHILSLNEENGDTESEVVEVKEKKKSKKKAEKNGVPEKLLSKKQKKKQEDDDDEEEVDIDNLKFVNNRQIIKQNDEAIKTPNAPFKRISDSILDTLHDDFKDNSYETFMRNSGNDYGREANDKLKVVRGKDFRKEKTKFKNKTSCGGFAISTQVKSIKLDVDSD